MRTITEIGNLWPRCKECNHIAQEHDNSGCSHTGKGQCPTCHSHVSEGIKCKCKGYDGPTWEEFKKQLTKEELEHYGYK